MTREAWGRWGDSDEIGALNHVTRDDVLLAASLVHKGQVLSLAQPLSKHTPVPALRPGFQHFMMRDGGDYAGGAPARGGFQFADDTVVMPLHIGTHLDALCHVWCDDQLYNGHSGNGTTSTAGAKRCGIDKLPPIVTRGLLLDVVALYGAPLAPGQSIGRVELESAARRGGVALRAGDAVLIRTGWQEAQQHLSPRAIDFDTEPGIDVEAALWLATAGVTMVGADNYAIEAMPFPSGTVFPVHQRLIRDFGITLLEGLVLETLAQTAVAEFLFVAAPLPIVGGTGSPITPLAIF